MVKWARSVGLTLVERDLKTMALQAPNHTLLKQEILQIFPFTSERKRMGIIVRVSGWLARDELVWRGREARG